MTAFPVQELNGKQVPVKSWAHVHDIESTAVDQLKNVASLPIAVHHIAVMPDVHFGMGATIGSVICTKDAISPAAVGVDLGCGMQACKTSLQASDLPDSLAALRHQVERDIPHGFCSHDNTNFIKRHGQKAETEMAKLFLEFPSLDSRVHNKLRRASQQVGTLGGGNHFVELCLDENQAVWLMLHSGSRNIGKELADIHINTAMQMLHNKDLPDPNLSYLLAGTPELKAYRQDLFWAQRYAKLNRDVMFSAFKLAMLRFFEKIDFEESIDCHHNYVSEEKHFGEDVFVTRKGAIFAGKGALGICPGSMGTRSYIVRGKGNADSFNSAAHGAGRRMSRAKAKKQFNKVDLEEQTSGVECRKDAGVIDEIPAAYKDIDLVMASQCNLVEVVAQLKQVMCVKG